MAEVGLTNPNLVDILSRQEPSGSVARILELLEKNNPILEHATYQECNNGSNHQTVIRTGISEPAFRKYNQGVQPSKTQAVPVTDTTGMIEDYNEVDAALARLGGNEKAYRLSEMKGKLQGFNNFVAEQMFYGSTKATPEGFMGLAPRYASLSGKAVSRNVIDGGGTGSDNTSIFFVTWDSEACQLLYPKGSVAGFQHRDLGEDTKREGGKNQQVLVDHLKWDIGLTLRDWRKCARICNIDVSNLTKDAASGADLLDLLVDAEESLDHGSGQTVIYVGRKVSAFLRKQIDAKTSTQLRSETINNKRVTMWADYPMYRVDAISETEAAVS